MAGVRWSRAVVTGASAGIGEAFARRLASEGTDLVLVARRGALLRRIAQELRGAHGVEVEICEADLTDPAVLTEVEELFAGARVPVDLLVNNAGGGEYGPFVERTGEGVLHDAMLNAVAVLRLTHAALRHMVANGRGNVIQVSAGVAYYPVPGAATYAASKAFVNSLSEAIGHELRGRPVRITTVNPGYTRTEAPLRVGFTEETVPRRLWMDPEDLVKRSLLAAERGRRVLNPGGANRFGAFVGRHVPHAIGLPFVARFANPRRRDMPGRAGSVPQSPPLSGSSRTR